MTDSSITDDSTFSIPDHVLSRKVSDEIVLLSLSDEQYYGLDGVGSRLWELVEAGMTFGEAAAVLAGEYAIDAPTIESDLRRLIADLDASNLIHVESST